MSCGEADSGANLMGKSLVRMRQILFPSGSAYHSKYTVLDSVISLGSTNISSQGIEKKGLRN
jgi:hypothetical protein